MAKNIIYLKESIFDLENMSSDYNDIETTSDENNELFRKNIISIFQNKQINRYLDKILSGDGRKYFLSILGENYLYSNHVCIYSTIDPNDDYNLKIFDERSDETYLPEHAQLRTFFKSILKQLFSFQSENKSNNIIFYDYDIDYNKQYHIFDHIFDFYENTKTKFYSFLFNFCTSLYCFDNIARADFLKEITDKLLDALVYIQCISEQDKKELMSIVNWEKSKVLFHFKLNKSDKQDFYSFYINELYYGSVLNLEDDLSECINILNKQNMSYFDFSDFALSSNNKYTLTINFDYKTSYYIDSDNIVNSIINYVKLIGIISGEKEKSIFLNVYLNTENIKIPIEYHTSLAKKLMYENAEIKEIIDKIKEYLDPSYINFYVKFRNNKNYEEFYVKDKSNISESFFFDSEENDLDSVDTLDSNSDAFPNTIELQLREKWAKKIADDLFNQFSYLSKKEKRIEYDSEYDKMILCIELKDDNDIFLYLKEIDDFIENHKYNNNDFIFAIKLKSFLFTFYNKLNIKFHALKNIIIFSNKIYDYRNTIKFHKCKIDSGIINFLNTFINANHLVLIFQDCDFKHCVFDKILINNNLEKLSINFNNCIFKDTIFSDSVKNKDFTKIYMFNIRDAYFIGNTTGSTIDEAINCPYLLKDKNNLSFTLFRAVDRNLFNEDYRLVQANGYKEIIYYNRDFDAIFIK